jgi:toxic protein SymE
MKRFAPPPGLISLLMQTAQNDNSKHNNDQQVKMMKVYSVYRDNINHSFRVPEIKISGKWLEKLGFNYGKKIMVTVSEGSLTIQLLEEQRKGRRGS